MEIEKFSELFFYCLLALSFKLEGKKTFLLFTKKLQK